MGVRLMAKNQIMFSTGVFINSSNDHDHTLIENIIPNLITPCFEVLVSDYFAERQSEYEEVAKIVLRAKQKGVTFPVLHMNQRIGTLISRNEDGDINEALQIFEFNCIYAAKFGVQLLVLHLWGGIPSDGNIEVNISLFPKLKEISDKYGLTLTIENVVCNYFKPLDHLKRLWALYGNDVKYTIDVRHAEFHKTLAETCASTFLWDNNLVRHLHISDYRGEYKNWTSFRPNNTPITYGDVDFGYFFSFLKSVGYSVSGRKRHPYRSTPNHDRIALEKS
jgi:sugar phosphate isomerase/epimerase